MNLKIPLGLLHATRLVRGGRLLEATDAIQRALRGALAVPRPQPEHADGDVIEGACRVLTGTEEADAIERSRRVLDPETPQRAPGEFVTRSYGNAAGTREYKTYVP